MFKMSYEEYFDAFDDIDELKKAAKVWVKEDIRRLEERDDLISTLTPDYNIVSNKFETLSAVLRRGSPLHKLWQDIHLKKYPANY